ncbi:MAG TPA: M4 family metallopeptidase [Thermoanaerobaculia bacterium]
MSEHKPRSADVEVAEAYDGSGTTFDFYAQIFSRNSIDGRGMRVDSTVHYGTRFDNAMWNGHQMVHGDGDGLLFNRFTAALDVIGHELTHGVTQFTAALGYDGQTGALNEHISDAFGIMVKQFKLNQTAKESDWLLGAGLFTSRVHGKAVRSMAAPGTAYDDPTLGRDPQPAHMRHYVDTEDDNGGVHINSGIPNHAFYLAAVALGGRTWEVLGRIWYRVLTERLTSDADFNDFTRATIDVAGEMFGNGGRVQQIVADAWSAVGLRMRIFDAPRIPIKRSPPVSRAAAVHKLPKWRQRPAR